MSWHFSRALAVEYSAANCSAGEQSAPSKSTPMPAMCCSPDKTTDASNPSRCGMTCELSTGCRGVGWWMSSLAASRARTSASPVAVTDSTVNGRDSGEKWPESWAKFDRDSSSWKTHQLSLFGGWESVSETWPEWGIMQRGECWALAMPVVLTGARESGFLLTPIRADSSLCKSLRNGYSRDHSFGSLSEQLITTSGLRPSALFVERMMCWPETWTDSQCSATDKFRQWFALHGLSCAPNKPTT